LRFVQEPDDFLKPAGTFRERILALAAEIAPAQEEPAAKPETVAVAGAASGAG
jgi:hypothetical protein